MVLYFIGAAVAVITFVDSIHNHPGDDLWMSMWFSLALASCIAFLHDVYWGGLLFLPLHAGLASYMLYLGHEPSVNWFTAIAWSLFYALLCASCYLSDFIESRRQVQVTIEEVQVTREEVSTFYTLV